MKINPEILSQVEIRRNRLCLMHNVELHDLYFSSPFVQVIKARRLRWERGEMPTEFWWGNLKERDHSEDMRRWEDNSKMDVN